MTYPLYVGGGAIHSDRDLLASAARQIERLLPYAHGLGTVETDDRDEARSCLDALKTVLGSAGTS